MNFQNLEYFIAVARTGNISKAAEQLNITQQALSNQISRMEQELGCTLFDRKHGFELTYSGKCFRDAASQILDINKQTESRLNDINANRRGELKIGISHTRGQAILPLVFPEFIKSNPQISLSVVESSTHDLEEQLEKGSIDIMIGFKPFMLEQAETIDLMTEHLYLVAAKDLLEEKMGEDWNKEIEKYNKKHDLSVFKKCPFVLLKTGDRIRDIADTEFARANIIPEIKLETGNIQTAYSLAAEGIGITLVPGLYLRSPFIVSGNQESDLRRRVEVIPFTAAPSTIAIGYHKNRYLSEPAKAFIELAKEKFAQI